MRFKSNSFERISAAGIVCILALTVAAAGRQVTVQKPAKPGPLELELEKAVMAGNTAAVINLLDKGANPNAVIKGKVRGGHGGYADLTFALSGGLVGYLCPIICIAIGG